MTEWWDEVKLDLAIQHHPCRDADPVYQALRGALPAARVVVDPDPDSDEQSPWRTYEACLKSARPWATHLLVLQDDVAPCPDFLAGVETAIHARPDRVLSFFISEKPQTGHSKHVAAGRRCESWSELHAWEWVPAQALCWPRWVIPPVLRQSYTVRADDEVLARRFREVGVTPLQSMPSLVEHVHHSSTTLARHGSGAHRAAACLLAAPWSALDVDWTLGAA